MKKEINENITQVNDINAGKIDVFTNDTKFKDEKDIYRELSLLEDYGEEYDHAIESYREINTGGNTIIGVGKFINGLYFAMNEDYINIFDEDYAKAREQYEGNELDNWMECHIEEYITNDDPEYNEIVTQIQELKPKNKED